MRRIGRPLVVVVVVAACVTTLKTSETVQLSTMTTPGSVPFGNHMVGTTSGSASLTVSETGSAPGSNYDSIISICLNGSADCSDFSLAGSDLVWGTCAQLSSAFVGQNCTVAALPNVMCGSSTSYTFYAEFHPTNPTGVKNCMGTVFTMGSGGSASNSFTLTGTATSVGTPPDGPPMDVIADDGGQHDAPGGGGGGGGGGPNGNGKDRQTYYACSTGAATGGVPVALAVLAGTLARRRRRR